MTALGRKLRCWLGIKPAEVKDREHDAIRKLVHETRNIATVAAAEARRLGEAASRAESVTHETIRRLEEARKRRDPDHDDRMAHPP
jgi:hypothetical protein